MSDYFVLYREDQVLASEIESPLGRDWKMFVWAFEVHPVSSEFLALASWFGLDRDL